MPPRFKIIIVNRERRFRKVTRKGGIHNRKYRPMLVPVATFLLLGCEAVLRGVPDAAPSPYCDPSNPSRPRIIEMHEQAWARLIARHPAFAAQCDLFARVAVVRGGVVYVEDVPL